MIIILWLGSGLTACSGPLSILDPASANAASVANIWWGMLVFSIVIMLVLVGLWFYAMRRVPDHSAARSDTEAPDSDALQRQHNMWIIGGGVLLPVASICLLLWFGVPVGNRMAALPADADQALQVHVTGHQWWWQVNYPGLMDGETISLIDEVHIPVDVPVHFFLNSADVIHSFWVPRLGGKLDLIPGRTNELRLQADTPGVYRGLCAEFCGLAHAQMQFELHVHTAEDFAAWLAVQPDNSQVSDRANEQEQLDD